MKFKILKIKDYSIKFQLNNIKFLWKSLDEPWNYENIAEMFVFTCDNEGVYKLIKISENSNCFSCMFCKSKGATNKQCEAKILADIEEYYNLHELYNKALEVEVQE